MLFIIEKLLTLKELDRVLKPKGGKVLAANLILQIILFKSLGLASYTSPSQYYDPERKLSLSSTDTKWDFFSSDDMTSKTTLTDKSLQFVARSPYVVEQGLQPTLTLRIDHGNWSTARAYGERWLKDFPKFGYELQMSRDSTIGNLKGFEMELAATQSKHVIRQFIVKSKQEFWVFTCTSDQKHFTNTWSACERILKTAKY
jgi:hypothetical protein